MDDRHVITKSDLSTLVEAYTNSIELYTNILTTIEKTLQLEERAIERINVILDRHEEVLKLARVAVERQKLNHVDFMNGLDSLKLFIKEALQEELDPIKENQTWLKLKTGANIGTALAAIMALIGLIYTVWKTHNGG